jgi:hypothetical protein
MYDFSQKVFVDEFPMFLDADATLIGYSPAYQNLPCTTYPLAPALSDTPPEFTPESTTQSPVLRC